jgi:hypothetical protein
MNRVLNQIASKIVQAGGLDDRENLFGQSKTHHPPATQSIFLDVECHQLVDTF